MQFDTEAGRCTYTPACEDGYKYISDSYSNLDFESDAACSAGLEWCNVDNGRRHCPTTKLNWAANVYGMSANGMCCSGTWSSNVCSSGDQVPPEPCDMGVTTGKGRCFMASSLQSCKDDCDGDYKCN